MFYQKQLFIYNLEKLFVFRYLHYKITKELNSLIISFPLFNPNSQCIWYNIKINKEYEKIEKEDAIVIKTQTYISTCDIEHILIEKENYKKEILENNETIKNNKLNVKQEINSVKEVKNEINQFDDIDTINIEKKKLNINIFPFDLINHFNIKNYKEDVFTLNEYNLNINYIIRNQLGFKNNYYPMYYYLDKKYSTPLQKQSRNYFYPNHSIKSYDTFVRYLFKEKKIKNINSTLDYENDFYYINFDLNYLDINLETDDRKEYLTNLNNNIIPKLFKEFVFGDKIQTYIYPSMCIINSFNHNIKYDFLLGFKIYIEKLDSEIFIYPFKLSKDELQSIDINQLLNIALDRLMNKTIPLSKCVKDFLNKINENLLKRISNQFDEINYFTLYILIDYFVYLATNQKNTNKLIEKLNKMFLKEFIKEVSFE